MGRSVYDKLIIIPEDRLERLPGEEYWESWVLGPYDEPEAFREVFNAASDREMEEDWFREREALD